MFTCPVVKNSPEVYLLPSGKLPMFRLVLKNIRRRSIFQDKYTKNDIYLFVRNTQRYDLFSRFWSSVGTFQSN